MRVRIFEIIKRDFKSVSHSWYLFIIASAPVLFILLMLLAFPLLADILLSTQDFDLYIYYSITAITMASLIPLLTGHFFTLLFARELRNIVPADEAVQPYYQKLTFRIRVFTSFILSLLFLLLFNFTSDPVPEEGWMRNCFAAFLFALQAPLVFIFAACYNGRKIKGLIVPLLYLLFVIAVPVGLVMYHPWNYLAFFSPFYWIAWAWIINSPLESIAYGTISAIITLSYFAILCRKKSGKYSGT